MGELYLKKEVRYMNILKSLAIISVVLGHCGFPYASVIYSYHMALFFFINGYFFKEEYVCKPKKFLMKKIRSLYVPFIVYEFIFIILRNALISIKVYNETQINPISNFMGYLGAFKNAVIFRYTGDLMLGTFWFLTVLFFVNILFLIIKLVWKKVKIQNKYIQFSIIFMVYILGFYLLKEGLNINDFLNPWNNKFLRLIINYLFDIRVLIFLMIYYLGHLYNKYEDRILINIYFSIMFLGVLYYLRGTWIDTSVYSFKSPLYFGAVSIMGIYFNIYIAKKLSRFKLGLLNYIGTNSFIIMTFHLLVFKIVSYMEIKYYNLQIERLSDYPAIFMGGYWWILYTLIGVLIPILIKYSIETLKRKIKSSYGYIEIENTSV